MRLDQHRGLDGAARDAERVLRGDEHVVPQPRLEMALQLRQVEVRARCRARASASCVVGRRTAPKSNSAPDTGSPSTRTCFSGRCQPRGRTMQRRGALGEPVDACRSSGRRSRCCAARRRRGSPGRSTMLSQVGAQESSKSAMKTLAPRVERVDDHLAVDRAGDLDAPVLQVRRHRRHAPVARRVPWPSPAESRAARRHRARAGARAPRQQLQAPRVEAPVQTGEQLQRERRQHLGGALDPRAQDLDLGARLLRECTRPCVSASMSRPAYAS